MLGKKSTIHEILTENLENSFEGDKTFFEGIYDRAWYKDTVDQLIEWLKEMSIHQETLQMLVMQHALFIVKYMIQANLDNLNRKQPF